MLVLRSKATDFDGDRVKTKHSAGLKGIYIDRAVGIKVYDLIDVGSYLHLCSISSTNC